MANRGQSWDAHVHSIADLREYGSQKLPKMYRDYYNEGAMDLVTYVLIVEIATKCSGIANVAQTAGQRSGFRPLQDKASNTRQCRQHRHFFRTLWK